MTAPTLNADVLVFVEDPGAANVVADLPAMLDRRGWRMHLATAGAATDFLRARGFASEALHPGCDLESIVARRAPGLVAIGTAENPDTFGLTLVAIAQRRGIPTVGLVDASTNLSHRFRGRSDDPLRSCPGTVIVPDMTSRDEFVEMGLASDRVVVAGHPHWDHVRIAGQLLQRQDRSKLRQRLFGSAIADRPVLVFASELSVGLNPQEYQYSADYSLVGDGTSRGRTEIVIEEFLRAIAPTRGDVHLVLRLHPKNLSDDLSSYRAAFDAVSQAEPSLELLHAADAVVGMTSMLMIEAALLGRPTLAILPRAVEAGWLPTIKAEVTRYATTRGAVTEEITKLLASPCAADRPALDRLFPPGARERVVSVLERLLTMRTVCGPGRRCAIRP